MNFANFSRRTSLTLIIVAACGVSAVAQAMIGPEPSHVPEQDVVRTAQIAY